MIILIGGEKGGTGKSTIATHLAVERKKRGGDVLLADTDKQASGRLWCDIRIASEFEPTFPCVALRGDSVAKELIAQSEKYTDIIVDAGGQDSRELRQALAVCDYVYTPIRASQFDIATIETMCTLVNHVRDLGSPLQGAFTIINCLSPNPKVQELKEAFEALEDYKDTIPVCPAIVRDRIAFRKANSEGMSVSELPNKDFSAIREIQKLYDFIFEQEHQSNEYQEAI